MERVHDLGRPGQGPRVSAKSVQWGGWVSRSMARRGRGVMTLVVAAMGAFAPWRSLMRPGGQVPQCGHGLWRVAGAQLVAVFARDHVPDPVEAVLHGPMPADPGRNLLGPGVGHGKRAEPGRPPRPASCP